MARKSLELRGIRTERMDKRELVGRAFNHSTSDFPKVLENNARKAMLRGYEEAEEVFQRFIVTSQAQKEVTHNDGLNRLDAFVTPIVADIADAPPGSPTVGDLYIVGTSPSGDFTGHANELAQYLTGGWVFYAPFKWMDAVLESLETRMAYDGSGWVPFGLIMKDSGEYLRIQRWQEDIDLSGGTTSATNIPNRVTVLAVNTRVITALTGTVGSFGVGVSGDTSRYGNGIGTAQDSTNVGLTYHPVSYYSDTPIEITPDSGSITGGVVRINVQYIGFRGPWNW